MDGLKIKSKKFKQQALRATVFFAVTIIFSILLFIVRLPKGFPVTSVINITADIFGIMIGCLLFVSCVIDVQKGGESLNCLLLLIITTVIALFSDEVAWIVDAVPKLRIINILDNTVYYMTTPVLAFFFWCYVVQFMHLEKKKMLPYTKAFFYSLVVAILIRIVNIFTGFYFTVDSTGVYHRSTYYFTSLIYAYFTLIATLVLVVQHRKKLQKYQIICLFMYVAAPLLISILTISFYGLSLSSPTIMMVCMLMYCVLNVLSSRDQAVANRDLTLASAIQEAALPRRFPPFPGRNEFDIHASMNPAKEVGGDFYDFFLIDDDHLAMVVADVSGKGIPAALFMMVSKTMIKNRALTGDISPSKVFESVNEQLCEGNQLEMFVTAWLGILTISTGHLVYTNAGHEYPALKRANGGFEIVKEKHSPPLATINDISFAEGEITLEKGDVIFMYTDGVTEATNSENELFGLDRMTEALNSDNTASCEAIDGNVANAIDCFVLEAPQFDDITMLCMRYNGRS